MVGIRFEVETGYNNLLYKIFYLIDVMIYEWEIITDDIINPKSSSKYTGIFDNDIVDGQYFLNTISKESYHLIFADFKAYPIGSEHKEIKTYADYVNSNCQMIFLCIDSGYIDIFCKDETILKQIYRNCIDNNFYNLNFISEKEAIQHYMVAW